MWRPKPEPPSPHLNYIAGRISLLLDPQIGQPRLENGPRFSVKKGDNSIVLKSLHSNALILRKCSKTLSKRLFQALKTLKMRQWGVPTFCPGAERKERCSFSGRAERGGPPIVAISGDLTPVCARFRTVFIGLRSRSRSPSGQPRMLGNYEK